MLENLLFNLLIFVFDKILNLLFVSLELDERDNLLKFSFKIFRSFLKVFLFNFLIFNSSSFDCLKWKRIIVFLKIFYLSFVFQLVNYFLFVLLFFKK